jgi:fumarate hydratase class II
MPPDSRRAFALTRRQMVRKLLDAADRMEAEAADLSAEIGTVRSQLYRAILDAAIEAGAGEADKRRVLH